MNSLKLEDQLCFPLYVASKEIIRKYRPYLNKLNLTYTQYITMMVLWENDEINIKELGERLYLDSGTLTPLLKVLENKGFIKRSRDLNDERNVVIKLTKKGMNLKEKASSLSNNVASCIKLNNKEAKDFYVTLYKIINNLFI